MRRWSSLVAAAVALGSLVVGCSNSGAGFSEACSSNSDCGDGMICPAGGQAKGICTADCTDDNDGLCEAKFGNNTICHADNVCVISCEDGEACPSDTYCYTGSQPAYCALTGYDPNL
jgi:hypothetical protein